MQDKIKDFDRFLGALALSRYDFNKSYAVRFLALINGKDNNKFLDKDTLDKLLNDNNFKAINDKEILEKDFKESTKGLEKDTSGEPRFSKDFIKNKAQDTLNNLKGGLKYN